MNALATIFQDASKSSSTHRKNIVALRKLHLKTGDSINKEVFKCVCRVITAKRGNTEAERVIKFLLAYLENSSHDNNTPQTQALTLTEYLLRALRHGLRSGNKVVRYRSCQLIGNLLNVLEEMDDEMFDALTPLLLERAHDKEALVRSNAATALSRLQGCGKTEEEDAVIRKTLLDMVRHDPNPDVRKVALWNIGEGPETLAYIVERSRDTDANVRKFVYPKIQNDYKREDLEDDARDQLLHNGLSDRDAGVKKASLKLLNESWLADGEGDIVDFLKEFDVLESLSAEETIRAYLVMRPDVKMPYDEEFWASLDAETSFFVRVYIQYCSENGKDEELDEALPPLVRHVKHLERITTILAQTEDEYQIMMFEFILGQVLKIAEVQDFSDEMGRRDMLVCLRNMVCTIELGDRLLSAITTIRKCASNEQEFMRFMVEEVLRTLLDQVEEEAEDDTPVEVRQAIILSKCLDIIKCILQCVEGVLSENPIMNVMLQDFIVPALRHPNAVIRGVALHCVGLYGLYDKALAQQQMPLFNHAFETGQAMACLVLQIYFDLIVVHGVATFWDEENGSLLVREPVGGEEPKPVIQDTMEKALDCDNEAILTVAVEGMAKLFVLGYVKDVQFLKQLVVLYFHPATKNMQRLRQCLSYFFPVYAHSSHKNQKYIQEIFLPAFERLLDVAESMPGAMISPMQIAQQLIDWTDVRKVVRNDKDSDEFDGGLHADVAIDILKVAIREGDPAIKKMYCQMLNKLHLGQSLDSTRAKTIAVLVGTLKEHVAGVAVAANALKKFSKEIVVLDEDSGQAITDGELRDLVQYRNRESIQLSDLDSDKSDDEEED
ncbi:hypothetical protein HK097_008045 [Rhizophlyctis rosea]|uniref:Nuclear condensin complex subunit 3 C-terminal domain-containing protein n=1 Tax=Rhizophlyctis rosea TaxID=64517 RepID=A0AAD5SIF0_9FUNG|nr:hypothetical protein HK097_008045 [Rhizophlyctis rosea]